jgi:hypothetical protein
MLKQYAMSVFKRADDLDRSGVTDEYDCLLGALVAANSRDGCVHVHQENREIIQCCRKFL